MIRVMKSAPIEQHVAGPAALDLCRPDGEPGQERRARRADVERARPVGAERVGDERRGVRRQLVLGHRRDDHEIDILAPDPGARSGRAAPARIA